METIEEVIFNRAKFMQIATCLIFLLSAGLLTIMIFFCTKKVIIVSDYEEENNTETAVEQIRNDVVWKIDTDRIKAEDIHIPLGGAAFTYDMDYVNRIFSFQIATDKADYYMSNSPYGDFGRVKSISAKYDGETVTYSMILNDSLEAGLNCKEGEAVLSLAPISHDKTVVLIDPGHGGTAVGNMAGGLMEKEVDLKVAQKVQALAANKPYKVMLTRNGDRKVGTGESLSIVNITEADYYISLHLDADLEDTKTFGMRSSYNGNYYRDGFENVDFADSLLRNVATSTSNKAIELFKSGEDELMLQVLKIPAATLYMGYISNSSEAELLAGDEYLKKIAEGIINSLDETIK